MNLAGGLHLGLNYLRRQKAKTTLLVCALGVAFFIPVGISIFVPKAEQLLQERATATPLVLGASGSKLELVFNSLYFSKPDIATIPIEEVQTVSLDGLTAAVPVYSRFSSQGAPIVGTSIDYFSFRGLTIQEGRMMTRLGDCVIGARLARERNIGVGDSVISSPEAVFDIGGVYPLKMRITGVLAPTGTVDDETVFCDVKTAWIIEGLAHGHQDAQEAEEGAVISREGKEVKLNASVVEYNEITEENVGKFHFHGDPEQFPITAVLLFPVDEKARVILMGRYRDASNGIQVVRPKVIMEELFATVFQVQNLVVAALLAVGCATLFIAALVFLLSNKLRSTEFSSLRNLGADLSTIRFLVAFEAMFVVLSSLVLTCLFAVGLHLTAPVVLRYLLH